MKLDFIDLSDGSECTSPVTAAKIVVRFAVFDQRRERREAERPELRALHGKAVE